MSLDYFRESTAKSYTPEDLNNEEIIGNWNDVKRSRFIATVDRVAELERQVAEMDRWGRAMIAENERKSKDARAWEIDARAAWASIEAVRSILEHVVGGGRDAWDCCEAAIEILNRKP